MSNDKKEAGIETPAGTSSPRRPYAMLDLKAIEVKATTKVNDRAEVNEVPLAAQDAIAASSQTPRPAAPSSTTTTLDKPAESSLQFRATKQEQKSWWMASASRLRPEARVQAAVKPQITSVSSTYNGQSKMAASQTSETNVSVEAKPAVALNPENKDPAESAKMQKPAASEPRTIEKTVIQKRGGFFSHTFAGLVGGALALGATQLAAPQLGLPNVLQTQSFDVSPFEKRLQALEKETPDTALLERIAGLEKTAQSIPALNERQTRLIAETKAALAASESSAGSTQQLERLDKIESQIKGLAAASATASSALAVGEQQTQMTAKLTDVETNFAKQIEALKSSFGQDIETRLKALRESSEAAKAGSERTGKDIVSVRSEATKLLEQSQALKADVAKLAERLNLVETGNASLKPVIDEVKAASSKGADAAAAVAPLTEKVAVLDKNVSAVLIAEADRRANAERVLLSLELQNLKRALDRGQSFGTELENVQKAGGEKIDLTALAKFKDQGVPAVAELSRDFQTVASAALRAEDEAPNGGVVDRLLSGAKAAIRVRSLDHAADDKTAEAVVGRMETALKNAKLGDVLAEAKDLSQKAQDAVRPFLDQVAARASVDAALSDVETKIKTSLSTPAQMKPPQAP